MHTQRVSRKNIAFLAAAVVATVLLAAFVTQRSVLRVLAPRNAAFSGIRPNPTAFLPAGALWHEASIAAVESLPSGVPAYAVAYTEGNRLSVALLRWDMRAGRFVHAGTAELALPAVGVVASAPPSLQSLPTAPGMPGMALLTDGSAAGRMVVALLVADDSGIRTARLVGQDGAEAAAEFTYPPSMRPNGTVELADVNGDGMPDLLVHEPDGSDALGVYEWRLPADRPGEGAFQFSERLSWAFALSRQLFPEPPATNGDGAIDATATAE